MADGPFQRLRRFLSELRRRNVYQVAATYAVVAFVVWQVANLLFPALGFPAWTVNFVIVFTLLGFPVALVVAWAFEVTPEGVQRTPESELEASVEEEPEPEGGPRTAYKVLVGLGLVAAAVAGGWHLTGGGGDSPEISERTVAVLPFEVSGSGTETWRDGMVSLLSTGLDGAAGLRAIADRTVFATWEDNGLRQGGATTEEALAVARQVGAKYTVLGTAAALGSKLQLTANIHATQSGARLGKVQVSGTADSVTRLANELTRRVIGVLAEETGAELQSADLASVTTNSVPALKAYLEGLRHRRAGQTQASIQDYRSAIRADSTFALPYARLAFLGLWRVEFQGQAMRRAIELSEQLPKRERRLIWALFLARVEHRTLAAADSLRRLTDDYPEDPFVWRSRGELIRHSHIPRGSRESEKAHKRAVALAPDNTSHYPHYVNPAIYLHRDSALAADRLEAMPDGEWKKMYRLGFDLVFSQPETRRRVLARYDTVSVPGVWLAYAPLIAPEDRDLWDQVFRRLMGREDLDDSTYGIWLVVNDLHRGRVQQALADLGMFEPPPARTACLMAESRSLGVPVPDSAAERYLEPEQLPAQPSIERLRCTGLYLIEEGRTRQLEEVIGRIRKADDTATAEGASEGHVEATIAELKGYRAWKRGRLDRAARLWTRSNESRDAGALWRGDLYRQLGELEKAEDWYRAVWLHPVAYERLGQLYEEMGKPDKAAAAYRRFIEAWEDADPELQPRVEAARKRLEELTATEGEQDD